VDTERLGMTDLQVSPITFGTWQLGGDWRTFDEREAIAAIRHARELGITLFDDGVVRDASAAWLRRGVEQSLRELGVDDVDLYHVHWPNPGVAFDESGSALQKLIDEGKIRHVGVSNYSPAQTAEFARARPVETLQPPSHLFRRTVSQLAIAWTLAHPAVHVAIVGARRPAHIEDSVGAADFALSTPDLAEIGRIMAGAEAVAGPSPESV
jgi:aryl-alcohol dehydrogenase-like predicted oxidoreductase